MTPAARNDAFLSQPMPNSSSRIPIASCSEEIGTRVEKRAEQKDDARQHTEPAAVPSAAGRQPRKVATASTMVKASTTSTSEARKAALIAGAAVDQAIIFPSSAVLVMRVEDPLRVIIEQAFAALQPLGASEASPPP